MKWCRDLDAVFALTAESWARDDADVGGNFMAAAALTELSWARAKKNARAS